MKAYKLFRVRKDGTIGPLFINRKQTIKLNTWLPAEDHPTKGFSWRPGWHCTSEPVAPHLKESLSNGEERIWYEVEIEDYTELNRPQTQGGLWYLANNMKVIGEVR